VLALQSLERGQAVFDFLQARRRRVELGRVFAKKERQILETRLHLVALIEIRAARASRSAASSASRFPDAGELGQRGASFSYSRP
jgi:hypothetical protein